MSWNHRVCKKKVEGTVHHAIVYALHEAFYNDDGEVWAVTEEPVAVVTDILPEFNDTESDAVSNLKQTLEWMLKALEHPIIDLDTYVFAKCPHDDELEKFYEDTEEGRCPSG